MKLTPLQVAVAMYKARCRVKGMSVSDEEIAQRVQENTDQSNEFDEYLFDAELMLGWFEANEPEARALAELILAEPPSPIEFILVDELTEIKQEV